MEEIAKRKKLQDYSHSDLIQKYGEEEGRKIWESIQQSNAEEILTITPDVDQNTAYNRKIIKFE